MSSFLRIKPGKRRVAIAAKVVDAITNENLEGAIATITAGPPAFNRWLALQLAASGGSPDVRPDRATAAADGCLCFAELPDGSYTVTLASPPGRRYGGAQKAFTVARDAHGDIAVTIATIQLPPSGVRGSVKAADTSLSLPLARVRIEGSGELSYCNVSGAFYLSGLQAGAARLSISAIGYQRASATAQVALGKIVDLGTIVLQPATA